MADNTHIEWTDATWNPVTGCAIVSPGCTNCYAMRLAGTRLKHHPSRAGLTVDGKAGPVWAGEVRLNEDWLDQPLRWKRPRRIFVCAHGDLFAEGVPDAWIDQVFAVMALAPQHTFQVLTKRAMRMRDYLCTRAGDWMLRWPESIPAGAWVISRHEGMSRLGANGSAAAALYRQTPLTFPLPNVWLGVSAERQREADERIPDLLATPAASRFVSAEPLLGPIDFRRLRPAGYDLELTLDALTGPWTYTKLIERFHAAAAGLDIPALPRRHTGLHWIIAGGESGDGARPMHPDWVRSIRDQCAATGTAFFFKQWGEHLPVGQTLPDCGKIHGATAVRPGRMKLHYGGASEQPPKHVFAERGVEFASMADGRLTFRLGKARAGRLLDGIEHNGYPGVAR